MFGRSATLTTLFVILVALPASALELGTDKDVYDPTDDIRITAYNDGPKLVSFGSSAPYVARNLETGEIVNFIGLAVMIDLAPGERTSFGIMGGQLAPGPWSLDFRYWEDGLEHCCQSVTFTVAESSTPLDEIPVSRMKNRYPRH